MADLLKDQFNRFRGAGQLISAYLKSPHGDLLREAEDSGVLDELEFLLEETRSWLDDDEYYDDLAWHATNGKL